MNRFYIVLFMGLLLVASEGSGQEAGEPCQLGAGAAYACFTVYPYQLIGYTEDNYSDGWKAFSGFLFFRQHTSKLINLGATFRYSWKTYGYTGGNGGLHSSTDYDCDFTVGYTEVILEPNFTIGNKTRFYMAPGLVFGVLTNSRVTGTQRSYSMPFNYDTTTLNGSAKSWYSQYAPGISAKFELEIPVGKNIQVSVVNRYDYTFGSPHFVTVSLGAAVSMIRKNKNK